MPQAAENQSSCDWWGGWETRQVLANKVAEMENALKAERAEQNKLENKVVDVEILLAAVTAEREQLMAQVRFSQQQHEATIAGVNEMLHIVLQHSAVQQTALPAQVARSSCDPVPHYCGPDAATTLVPLAGTCLHGSCNINIGKSVAHLQVCNATLIDSSDSLYKWFAHMRDTLLSHNNFLFGIVENFFNKNFRHFRISWCGARCNRMFLIECRNCGGGTFGHYSTYSTHEELEEPIQKLARFVNVQLEPGSIQC